MPRSLSAGLRRVLERANPQHAIKLEVSAPDVAQVLRRPDQWLAPVSTSASPHYVVDERGAVTLEPTPGTLASTIPASGYPAGSDTGQWNIDAENPARRLKAAALQLDPAFEGARLQAITARVTRSNQYAGLGTFGVVYPAPLSLQIYRATGVAGFVRSATPITVTVDGKSVTQRTRPFTQWTFTPLLPEPAVLSYGRQAPFWGNAPGAIGNPTVAHLRWDLSGYGITLDQIARPSDDSASVNERAEYYIVIQPPAGSGTGHFAWRTQTATGAGLAGGAHATAGVGILRTVWWVRDDDAGEWTYNDVRDESPLVTIEVDTYPAPVTLDYAVDLGRAPSAGTTGRVIFERGEPRGTAATIALSTNGGTTYATTANEAMPAVAQQNYRARIVLTPSADTRRAPRVSAAGVEYDTAFDVSPESTVTLPAHEIAAPTLVPAIADATASALRLGRRDYADLPTQLATAYSPAQLEARVYVGSDLPSVSRADWLLVERMSISTRDGDGTADTYSLLSLQKQLKRKVPRRVETITQTLTVSAGATTTSVPVAETMSATGAVVGTYSPGSGQYFAQGYYIEVRRSATLPVGAIYQIVDNQGQHILRFDGAATGPLPGVAGVGDTLILHSGRKALAPIRWLNQDPAVVLLELLTLHAEIPRERIGRNDLRNGGLPPTVAMREPTDTARREALKVTRQVDSETEVAALVNSLSYVLGGAWQDVGGQLCWVQYVALRDAAGAVTVPLGPSVATFGPQDYSGLQVPSGLASRQTEVSVDYGVNTAAANTDATPTQTVSFVDADALLWHTHQDLEDAGTAKVSDDVSKWLYNSADGGLALASEAAGMPVRATSTGLRLWPFTTREPRFDLLPGDVVTVLTDLVTDYDPATKAAIKGWVAFTGPLVKTQGGRNFTLWVQGLPGNAVRVTGGPAAITGGASAAVPVPTDTAISVQLITTPTSARPVLVVRYTRPDSPFFARMRYLVERRRTGDTAWAAPYAVAGTSTGNDSIPADFNTDYRVTPVTVSSGGTETPGAALGVVATGESPRAEVYVTNVARQTDALILTYSYNTAFRWAEVWTKEYATDQGLAFSVERIGQRLTTDINRDARFSTIRLACTPGNWLYVTLVPYNGATEVNVAGIANVRAQTDSGATPPAAPTSAVAASHTATTITETVTPSVAGSLRPYLNGTPYGPDVLGVSAGVAVSITHTALSPATTYTFTYASVTTGGVESTARTTGGTVTTAAATLPTPTISAGAYDPDVGGYYVTVTNAGSFPAGTLFTLDTTEGESSTTATVFRSRAGYLPVFGGTSETVTVTASLNGYGSATSSGATVSVP